MSTLSQAFRHRPCRGIPSRFRFVPAHSDLHNGLRPSESGDSPRVPPPPPPRAGHRQWRGEATGHKNNTTKTKPPCFFLSCSSLPATIASTATDAPRTAASNNHSHHHHETSGETTPAARPVSAKASATKPSWAQRHPPSWSTRACPAQLIYQRSPRHRQHWHRPPPMATLSCRPPRRKRPNSRW